MQIWNELSAFSVEILAIVRPDFSIELHSRRWQERLCASVRAESGRTDFGEKGCTLSHLNVVHSDDQSEFEFYVRLTLSGHQVEPFESRIRVDGRSVWVRWHLSKSKQGEYLLAAGKEITDEKMSRSYLQQIEQASLIGGWEIDMDTHELRWSPQCYRIHEVDPSTYRPRLEDGISYFTEESQQVMRAAVERLMTTGESYDLKLRMRTGKGRLLWVRAISKVEIKNGRVIRCYGSIQDITDAVQREAESKQVAERFQAIANNIPVMLSLFNSDGEFLWCNPNWAAELGWDLESMRGRDMMVEFYPEPDHRQEVSDFMMRAESGWRDFLTRKRDGEFIYTSWANVRLSDGNFVGIGRNVDAEYRLHQDLKTAHEKIRLAMRVGGLGTWELFPQTGVVHFSDEWLAMLGLRREEVLDSVTTWERLVHPEDRELVNVMVGKCIRGEIESYQGIQRLRHADGSWISVQPFGQVVERDANGLATRFMAVTLDVTQSKLAESLLVEQNQLLEKMKERLELAVRAGKYGVWDWSLKTNELVWDALMYEIFEVDPMGFESDYPSFQSYLHPEDAPRVRDQLDYTFRTRAPEFQSEFRIVTPKGNVKIVAALASCFYDQSGEIDRLVGNNWDVTERRNAEAALAEARVEAERFFTMSLDPLCVADFDGNFRRVNPALLDVLGYTEREIREKRAIEFVHPDDLEASKVQLRKLLAGVPTNQFENRVKAKDGRYRTLSWVATPDMEAKVVFCAFRDITGVRENELKLLQSARMATLGEMAGGIAHEVNNPLAIIHGRAQQILRALDCGPIDVEKLKLDIGKIESTAERIAKIVKGLRTFSRDSKGDPLMCESVQGMVHEVLDLARERFKNHEIDLQVSIKDEVHVLCRSQQFGQVLLNLVNNAHDAVVNLPEKWVRIEVKRAGNAARISVVDSGNGIAPQVAMKMMNPFFTTKDVGKGTGLGLSISKGIAEDHGGRLVYDSTASHTTFVFELPLYEVKGETATLPIDTSERAS